MNGFRVADQNRDRDGDARKAPTTPACSVSPVPRAPCHAAPEAAPTPSAPLPAARPPAPGPGRPIRPGPPGSLAAAPAAGSSPPAGAALSGARLDPEPVSLAPASHCSSPAADTGFSPAPARTPRPTSKVSACSGSTPPPSRSPGPPGLRSHARADGIERSAEQWFRRYNAKAPSPGLTPSPIFALKHFTS